MQSACRSSDRSRTCSAGIASPMAKLNLTLHPGCRWKAETPSTAPSGSTPAMQRAQEAVLAHARAHQLL